MLQSQGVGVREGADGRLKKSEGSNLRELNFARNTSERVKTRWFKVSVRAACTCCRPLAISPVVTVPNFRHDPGRDASCGTTAIHGARGYAYQREFTEQAEAS